jgi:fumarate reductase flavoprotein subunit
MLRKYTKWKQPGFYTGCPSSTGDGIRMAESAGADLDGMDVLLMFGVTASIPPDLPGLSSISTEPLLYVNRSGERVTNEWYQSWPEFGNSVVNQKDQTLILIFDEDSKNYFINNGKRRVFHGRKIGKIDNLDEQIQEGIKRGIVYQAATLDALAAQIGADPTILELTITEYNKCCDKKHDEMFLKDPKYLDPVRKPPFYAIFFPDAFFCATLGGARINKKCQVLEAESFKIIPGLYAVGNDAAGMYGDTYTIHLPGMQQCFAINSGRIAGENAAADVL